MAHLCILQSDIRTEARLSDALSGTHEVSVVKSWAELGTLVEQGAPDGCVVDADSPSREEAFRELLHLRKRHPDLALVAYADMADSDREILRLGSMGIHGVVLSGRPPWASGIRRAVERALTTARAGLVERTLGERYGDAVASAVAWAVEHATEGPTVATFAAALGRSPRSLATLLRQAGLPPAGRILLWGRLLQAGAYLGRDGRTVEDTALRLGYSTASALSRAMKRETGKSPGDVARRGGLPFVHATLFPRRRPRTPQATRSVILAGLAFIQTACASAAGGGPPLDRNRVDGILDAPPVDQVSFGVLAVDAATGSRLYARNAHRKFIPASNQKILVTATALSLLGPDFTFHTGLWGTGPVADGTLDGDLVMVGTGDPTLSDRYWANGEEALTALADSLRGVGVTRVTGSLVVDVATWDSTSVGPTWEVEDLRYTYGATGGAFALDQGEIQTVITAGAAEGEAATVTWSPLGDADYVTAEIITAHPDSSRRVRADYLPESRRLVLSGHIGAGATDTVSYAVRDPVRQATATLLRVLGDRGITVEGGATIAWDGDAAASPGCVGDPAVPCPGATHLAGLTSPPLAEIVAGILEPSQNWMTEQLLRALGANLGEEGSWPGGVEVVRGFLVDSVGVDSLDVAPRDGSGLSAYNLVTPRALVSILRYMAAGPYAQAYREAMASPGEEDSTLERRLPELQGRLFAKTGTISNVNSLSGYLVGVGGREVVFSILSNGSGLPSARVRAAMDDVVRTLAGISP